VEDHRHAYRHCLIRSLLVSAQAFVLGCAFGATVNLGDTALECNRIDLDGESTEVGANALIDLEGNTCVCEGASAVCKVLSASLAPPSPRAQ